MIEILKAMREQKKIRLDVYKKGASLAFWVVLEKCEILIVPNKSNLDCQMLTDEEIADKTQDDLLNKGFKAVEITDEVIKRMEKIQKQLLKKALNF